MTTQIKYGKRPTTVNNMSFTDSVNMIKNNFRVSREMLKNDVLVTVTRGRSTKYIQFTAKDKSIQVYN